MKKYKTNHWGVDIELEPGKVLEFENKRSKTVYSLVLIMNFCLYLFGYTFPAILINLSMIIFELCRLEDELIDKRVRDGQ